jgi:hypothetical protein
MNPLILRIANVIRDRIVGKVHSLPDIGSELRTVFHGPPMELLRPIFNELAKDGGVRVEIGNNRHRVVPILLLSETATIPPP